MNDEESPEGTAPRPVFSEHEVASGAKARSTEFLWSLGIGALLGGGWLVLVAATSWFHRRTYRSTPWWLELLVYVVTTRVLVSMVLLAATASQRRARRRAGVRMRSSATLARALLVGQLLELVIAVIAALTIWAIARGAEHSWLLALPVPFVLWLTVTSSSRRVLRAQLPLEPLRDERCLGMLTELAAAAGLDAPRAELLRSSEWSPAVNAAVVRDGRTQALVVFDTALDLPDEQLRALLAHELGHVARSDARAAAVVAGIISAATVAIAFALLPFFSFHDEDEVRLDATAAEPITVSLFDRDPAKVAQLAPCRATTGRIDIDCVDRLEHPHGTTPYRGLPLAYVDLAAIAFALTAAGGIARARWQRPRERDADTFALNLTRDPAAFVGLVRSLTVSAGAAVHARGVGCTHASPAQRIELAREWADAHGMRPSAPAAAPAAEDEAERARADERDEERPQAEVADAATTRRVEQRTTEHAAEHTEQQREQAPAALDAGDALRERTGDEPDDDPAEEAHDGGQSSGT